MTGADEADDDAAFLLLIAAERDALELLESDGAAVGERVDRSKVRLRM